MDSKFLDSVEKNRAKIPCSGGGRDIPVMLGPSELHATLPGFQPNCSSQLLAQPVLPAAQPPGLRIPLVTK